MSNYLINEEGEVTPECRSEKFITERITEAQKNGHNWYFDMGESDDGVPCTLLIVEDGIWEDSDD